MEEGVLCTAEKRLEERTRRKLEAIKDDFALRLGGGESGDKTRAQTERELESALQQTKRQYETQKRQFDIMRTTEGKDKEEATEVRLSVRTQRSSIDASDIPATRPLAYLEQLERDVKATIRGHCYRLESLQQAARVKEVLMFLNLRSRGCPRSHAINFASKLRCRIDSSQRFDGPAAMRTVKRVNNLKDGISLNGWQVHSPKYALPAQFQQLVIKEDEIDYEAITGGFERFERKHRIVNGEVEERAMDLEVHPPPSFKSLHRRFASQEVAKTAQLQESPQPPVLPEKLIKPLNPPPALKTLLLPQAETASITPLVRSQVLTPSLLPTIQPKHIPHRHSRHIVPRLPLDVIDSVKVDKTCRLVLRSLRPQASEPELLPRNRMATVIGAASHRGLMETGERRMRRQGTVIR